MRPTHVHDWPFPSIFTFTIHCLLLNFLLAPGSLEPLSLPLPPTDPQQEPWAR